MSSPARLDPIPPKKKIPWKLVGGIIVFMLIFIAMIIIAYNSRYFYYYNL